MISALVVTAIAVLVVAAYASRQRRVEAALTGDLDALNRDNIDWERTVDGFCLRGGTSTETSTFVQRVSPLSVRWRFIDLVNEETRAPFHTSRVTNEGLKHALSMLAPAHMAILNHRIRATLTGGVASSVDEVIDQLVDLASCLTQPAEAVWARFAAKAPTSDRHALLVLRYGDDGLARSVANQVGQSAHAEVCVRAALILDQPARLEGALTAPILTESLRLRAFEKVLEVRGADAMEALLLVGLSDDTRRIPAIQLLGELGLKRSLAPLLEIGEELSMLTASSAVRDESKPEVSPSTAERNHRGLAIVAAMAAIGGSEAIPCLQKVASAAYTFEVHAAADQAIASIRATSDPNAAGALALAEPGPEEGALSHVHVEGALSHESQVRIETVSHEEDADEPALSGES